MVRWGLNPIGKMPKHHRHAWKEADCGGPLKRQALAHSYETDVLKIDFNHALDGPEEYHWSLLYALLEAAADVLQIARDDIDGTLSYSQGEPSLILFDTVPGGAGCVLQVAERMPKILTRATTRVAECECGPETSCYSCLRSYRNQRRHDMLTRQGALILLEMAQDH